MKGCVIGGWVLNRVNLFGSLWDLTYVADSSNEINTSSKLICLHELILTVDIIHMLFDSANLQFL